MSPLLQVGDRVTLTRDTPRDHAGKLGTVVRKISPMDIIVRWDGAPYDIAYRLPNGGLIALADGDGNG